MIWIIISFILTIILLTIGLNIKIKDINKIKTIGYDNSLNEITDKLPENEEVCKSILKMLNNNDVKIEKEENSKTSLYMVMQNKIIIGNIKNSFTRIQTIAHECIHSIQNKGMLIFNFIFSNIYILYFFIVCVLAMLKVTNMHTMIILLIILILLGIIHIIVRGFLEIDAMTRAPYTANEYINKFNNITDEEKILVKNKYEEINSVGIKLYMFILASKSIIKSLIYSIIILVVI